LEAAPGMQQTILAALRQRKTEKARTIMANDTNAVGGHLAGMIGQASFRQAEVG